MNRLKWIALGLASVAAFVVAVIGVEVLIASSVPVVEGEPSRGSWAEAITAVSTVVVMAATTVYATITYQMVQAMRQQTMTMAASSTRAHVTEFSRYLTTWINPLLALKASVAPGSRSPVDGIAELDEAVERVSTGNFGLASFSSACPPNILLRIRPVTDASSEAMAMVELVRQSIVASAWSAMAGNLPCLEDLRRRTWPQAGFGAPTGVSRAMDPSWDDVRNEYLLHIRDGAPGKPEWDHIISGKWLGDVEDVWAELITACTSYLQAATGP